MTDLGCDQIERVIKTEIRVDGHDQQLTDLLTRIDRLTVVLEKHTYLLTRTSGMIAGAAFLVSLVWAMGLALWRIVHGAW